MVTKLKACDVCVVGLGAVGGVAVLPLTLGGKRVVALEAGGRLETADFAPDELKNNYRGWPQSVQKANLEIPTHRDADGAKQSERKSFHPMMNAVGGTSLHYWGQSWRLNPWDFKVVSETTKRYGASRIPQGSTVEDWPFDYAELEPFYDRVEREIGVSGVAGNLRGQIQREGNPFEGERRNDYPMPPLRGSPFTDTMSRAAERRGWHPFPGPAAVNSEHRDGRPPCMYHGFCNRGGCHVRAKGSTLWTTIPKAEETRNLEIITLAHVRRIEVDARTGLVSGVSFVRGSEEFFQPASVVLLASYTYENVRLLLLSTSKPFPKGLSNNHNQVGRHYFSHNQAWGVTALFPMNLNNWYGLPAQGVGVDNYADDNFDHTNHDFIGGGLMWVYSDRRPIGAASMHTFDRPRWGADWKSFIRENADRWNRPYLQKTTLPYESNYLDLDPETKDPLGDPVIRITFRYMDNERKCGEFMQKRMAEWYMEAGASRVDFDKAPKEGSLGPSTHAYGGTRMGHNKETNVVDQHGFSHEVPNLGILGASVMGTSGSRNPTLTAQALAWRTSEHLIKNWRSIGRG